MRQSLVSRLQSIRLLAMDVDGVLTDGTILLAPDGEELKGFFSRDGIGLKCLHLAGLHSAFVTARGSPAVTRRARELGVRDVVLNSKDKGEALRRLAARRRLPLRAIAFLGDDLQDLPALLLAGVSFAVADAPRDVRERVDVVTRAAGGRGAVREAIERLLAVQGRWRQVLGHFTDRRRTAGVA